MLADAAAAAAAAVGSTGLAAQHSCTAARWSAAAFLEVLGKRGRPRLEGLGKRGRPRREGLGKRGRPRRWSRGGAKVGCFQDFASPHCDVAPDDARLLIGSRFESLLLLLPLAAALQFLLLLLLLLATAAAATAA